MAPPLALFCPFGVADGVAEILATGDGLKVAIGDGELSTICVCGIDGVNRLLIQTRYPAKSTKIKMITTIVTFLLKNLTPSSGRKILLYTNILFIRYKDRSQKTTGKP